MFWRFFKRSAKIRLDALVVGLGNPGKEYESTRHNIGFDIVDSFRDQLGFNSFEKKRNYIYSYGEFNKIKIALVKPQTYMNNSGEIFKQLAANYEFELSNILIVHDDLDLSLGDLRFRRKGSSGGHNGLKSIEKYLKTTEYGRFKFGIGRKKNVSVIEYVLSRWNEGEKVEVVEGIQRALLGLENWVVNPGCRELLNNSLKKSNKE
ncbi:MAG: aminoacyl-tRNA hydrolase [Planctomycetota bacterium]|nr:MAG: aminoacyl-tRNA hydrolase [Planctomycetota bacterium]